jgi:DNA-binding NarL/FixJ family response regulator
MNKQLKHSAHKRILIVDDHPLMCDALVRLISSQTDLDCTGIADNTADARRLAAQLKPDLIVLDLRLKSGDALDLIKTLRVEEPDVNVLVLSYYDELMFAERVLRAGASGYVMKENVAEEILRAVRKVLAGDIYFSDQVAAQLVRQMLRHKPDRSRNGVEHLSDRELQVFQLISMGVSTSEIAQQFHLSIKTIETHRENIKSKLGLQDAAELNRFARDWAAQNLVPSARWSTEDNLQLVRKSCGGGSRWLSRW